MLFMSSILSNGPSTFRDSPIEQGKIASGNSVFLNIFYARYQRLVTLPVFGEYL
jgi:hypothetical protein